MFLIRWFTRLAQVCEAVNTALQNFLRVLLTVTAARAARVYP